MDYVTDFIVHVFSMLAPLSAEKRAFYGLERLRKSATTLSIADLNAELKAAIATTRAKSPKKAASKPTAPAVKKATSKPAPGAKKPAKTVKKAAVKAAKKAVSPRKPAAKTVTKARAKTSPKKKK